MLSKKLGLILAMSVVVSSGAFISPQEVQAVTQVDINTVITNTDSFDSAVRNGINNKLLTLPSQWFYQGSLLGTMSSSLDSNYVNLSSSVLPYMSVTPSLLGFSFTVNSCSYSNDGVNETLTYSIEPSITGTNKNQYKGRTVNGSISRKIDSSSKVPVVIETVDNVEYALFSDKTAVLTHTNASTSTFLDKLVFKDSIVYNGATYKVNLISKFAFNDYNGLGEYFVPTVKFLDIQTKSTAVDAGFRKYGGSYYIKCDPSMAATLKSNFSTSSAKYYTVRFYDNDGSTLLYTGFAYKGMNITSYVDAPSSDSSITWQYVSGSTLDSVSSDTVYKASKPTVIPISDYWNTFKSTVNSKDYSGVSESSLQSSLQNLWNTTSSSAGGTIGISGYSLQSPTIYSTGSVTFNISISGVSGCSPFTYTKILPKTPATLSGIYDMYNSYINNLQPTNSTTQDSIINGVNLPSGFSASFTSWNLTKSDDKTSGSLVATLKVTDTSSGSSKSITINKTVARLAQTLTTAKSMAQGISDNYTASNTSSQSGLLNAINGVLDTSVITPTISSWTLTPATESKIGSLVYTITLKEKATSATTTISATKEIGYLPQSVDTVFNSYSKFISNFKATNTTTESDIKSGVIITNQSITASVSGFSVTPATDKAEGHLNGTLTVYNNGSAYKTISLSTVSISKIAQTVTSAKGEVSALLDNMQVTNSTTKSTIESLLNSSIDSSVLQVAVTISSNTKATESASGNMTGYVTITKSSPSESVQVPFNKTIDTLPQSIDTVYSSFVSDLSKFKALNSTTSSDILSLVGITNSSITKSVSNFSVTASTETKKGHLNGTLTINNGSTTKTIDLSTIEIDIQSQSVNTVYSAFNEILQSFKATNSSTKDDILNLVGITNSSITKSISGFSVTPATETTKGHLNGTLTIASGSETKTISLSGIVIDVQSQSVGSVFDAFTKVFLSFKATNDSTKDDVLNLVTITNPSITKSISNFSVTQSTELSQGHLNGVLTITDGNTTKTIDLSKLLVDAQNQSVSTVYASFNNVLSKFKATNTSTKDDILNLVSITNSSITKVVSNFSVTQATENKNGHLNGTLSISDGKVTKTIDLSTVAIDIQTQSVTTVETLFNKVLANYKATNSSTKEDILSLVSITNPSISATVSSFSVTPATESAKGHLNGTLSITDGVTSKAINLSSVVIDIQNQTVNTAYASFNKVLANFDAKNSSTASDITGLVSITNPSIKISISGFSVTSATESKKGHLNGILTITDGAVTKTIDLSSVVINVQNQTIDTVFTSFHTILSNYKATNSTASNDLLNLVSITNSSISKSISGFTISPATEYKKGHLNGVLTLTDGANTKTIDLSSIEIDILSQTIDTVYTSFNNVLANYKATNSSTKDGVLGLVEVTNSSITKSISNFSVTPATEVSEGHLNGTLTLTDGKATKTIDLSSVVVNIQNQTLDTVFTSFNNVLSSYRATNSSAERDILNLVGITNPNISKSIKDFSITPATEVSKGHLNGVLSISSGGVTKTINLNSIVIDIQNQSANTVFTAFSTVLSNYKATNSSKETDILNLVTVTNPSISKSISQFSVTPATEFEKGHLNGILSISEGSVTKTINLNSVIIDIQSQTVDTAFTSFTKVLSSYKAVNSSTSNDILDLVSITNPSISKKISNFSVTPATEFNKGHLNGTLTITDGVATKTIDLSSVVVDIQSQTVNTVYDSFNKVLEKYKAMNDSMENDILNLVTITNSSISKSISNFSVTLATETERGHLNGVLTITDGKVTKTINLSSVFIDVQSQSASTLYSTLNGIVSNFKATNSTKESDLLSLVQITNADLSLSIDNFSVTSATDTIVGHLNGRLNVKDKGVLYNSIDLSSVSISKLPTTLSSANTVIKDVLSNLTPSNSVTESDINKLLNGLVSQDTLSVVVKNWELNSATETSKGNLSFSVEITNSGGETTTVEYSKEINVTNQSIETALKQYQSILSNYKGTNSTGKDDILDLVLITNPDISTKIDDFKLTPATEDVRGKISGTLVLSSQSKSESLPFSIVIDKLSNSISTIKNIVQGVVDGYDVTNNTTSNELQSLIEGIVGTDVSITISDWELKPSTEINKGSLKATIDIEDIAGDTATITVSKPFGVLEQSGSSVLSQYQNAVDKFKATNSTVSTDILNLVNITNSSVSATLDDMIVNPATDKVFGSLTGTLVVKDNGIEVGRVDINKEIGKLAQTVSSAKKAIDTVLPNIGVSNSTKSDDVLDIVSSVVDTDAISISISKFKLSQATEFKLGSLDVGVLIADNHSATTTSSAVIVINKIEQSAETVYKSYSSRLESFKASNSSTENDILNLVLINNSNISAKVNDLEIVPASNSKDGLLTGTLVVYANGVVYKSIDISKVISGSNESPDSIVTIIDRIQDILNSYVGSNATTQDDIQSLVNSAISTNTITGIVVDFNKHDSGIGTNGSIDVTVEVKVGSNGIHTLESTIVIPGLNTGLSSYEQLIINELSKLVPNNDLTIDDIISSVSRVDLGNDAIAVVKSFNLLPANTNTDGLVVSNILLSSSRDSQEITITYEETINKLNIPISDIIDKIQNLLNNIVVDTSTSKDDIQSQIDSIIKGTDFSAKVDDFIVTPPTSTTDGKIDITINIEDGKGNKDSISDSLVIGRLPEELAGVKESVSKILEELEVSNSTSKQDILTAISPALDERVTSDIDNFLNSNSTESSTGLITGHIIISNGTDYVVVQIDKTIAKLPSSSGGGSTTIVVPEQVADIIIGEDISITTTEATDEESTVISNKAKSMFGNHSHTNVSKWVAYKNNEIVNQGYTGTVYQENKCIGVLVDAQSPLDDTTNVELVVKTTVDDLSKIYVHNNDLNKYVLTNKQLTTKNSNLTFTGSNKNEYVVSAETLDSNVVADQGWNLNKVDSSWSYIKNEDTAKGWVDDNGWFNLDSSGKMRTSWVDDNGWYYLNPVSDGTKGKMKTGWIYSNNNWFYLTGSGKMATDWYSLNDNYYYFNKSTEGVEGSMTTGWKKVNNDWYYFYSDGVMATDTVINGYNIDANGKLV